jgi:hypothetical protein
MTVEACVASCAGYAYDDDEYGQQCVYTPWFQFCDMLSNV